MDKKIIKEIKRFIKNNYIKIIITSIVIGLAYSSINLLNVYFNREQKEDTTINKVETHEPAQPGVFRFYVETAEGEVYSNITIFEEYFLTPETINRAEAATQVEISDLLEQQELSEFEKTIENRGVIGVGKDQSSGIFTFKARLGTAEENLEVAEFYYDYLQSEEIPVLEDKNLYIIAEPFSDELTEEEEIDLSSTESMNEPGSVVKKAIVDLGLGIVLGLVISSFGYLFVSIINKKIQYSFTYNWEIEDTHLIVNNNEYDMKDALALILNASNKQKVILTDNFDLREKIVLELKNYSFVNVVGDSEQPLNNKVNIVLTDKISNLNPLYSVEELIYAIKIDETTKEWYNSERNITDHYSVQKKVLQFND